MIYSEVLAEDIICDMDRALAIVALAQSKAKAYKERMATDLSPDAYADFVAQMAAVENEILTAIG